MVTFVWIYGVLRYLSSIGILIITRDQTTHLPLVQRPIPQIIDPSHTTHQSTNPLMQDLCLQVLTMHGNELRPYSYYAASDIAAVGTTFNVFSYVVVWAAIEAELRSSRLSIEYLHHGNMAEHRTHNLPVPSATCYATDAGYF